MLYSEAGDRLVFVVDKGSFPQGSISDVVDRVYSSIKTRQLIKVAKQEVEFQKLIQELVEPTCGTKESYLEGDLVYDDTYYLEMAAFELQDTDFLVPMHQLIQKTDQFSVVFGPNFRTSETPTQFPGVTANEFRGLMKYLYPLEPKDELTTDDWISILKLSTKWRMLTLREEAILKLKNGDPMSAIMKVQLGNECKIVEWVRSGYVTLVERDKHFTEADVIAIGLDNVTKLCELREQRYAREWDTYCNRLTLEAYGTSNLIADRISRISTVDHLEYDGVDIVKAILDAHSLGSRRLMLDAWGRMARRNESLALDEVERLTLGIAIMMWEVRLEMRRAAWALVLDYGAKLNVKGSNASQSIASTFALELEQIEIQALSYALIKPTFDKGKTPAVNVFGDMEEKQELLDFDLEPMPQGNVQFLFTKSLDLRKRIQDLEHELAVNTDTTLSKQLWEDLRRCRLTTQNWCTLVNGSSPPQTTLNLNNTALQTVVKTVKEMIAKLILKNAGKLSLDGSHLTADAWHEKKANIVNWIATSPSCRIKARVVENRKVIDLILPVSES